VRVLLDSHAFLWWVLDVPNLSDRAREILSEGSNEVLFSVACAYELVYKAMTGRLQLPERPDMYVRSRLASNGFESLPIAEAHALRAGVLPRIHGDPVDRILIAQGQVEGLPIVTIDPLIARYDVETIW
jgi:PIN domain nuclease of toxin-antitoxin system